MNKPEMEFNILDNPSELKQTFYIYKPMNTKEQILRENALNDQDAKYEVYSFEDVIRVMDIYANLKLDEASNIALDYSEIIAEKIIELKNINDE